MQAKPDFKAQCEKLLSDEAMVAYYKHPLIEDWKQEVEECKDDQKCLETSYEYLLDKYGEAKAEIEIQKLMKE